MARPQSDQPLLDGFEEVTGLGPAYFLNPTERAIYDGAGADAQRFTERKPGRLGREPGNIRQAQVRRSATMNWNASWPIGTDSRRWRQGERFVQRTLRNRAREHERFVVGAPAAMLSLTCLALLACVPRRRPQITRRPSRRRGA